MSSASGGSVTATLERGGDLLGVLGVDPQVRNGFSAVRVVFDIDADARHRKTSPPSWRSRRGSEITCTVTAVRVKV